MRAPGDTETPERHPRGDLARGDGRTRVERGAPDEPSWELWLRAPLPGLAHLVVGFWAGDADAPSACHRTVPDGEVALQFNLGPPQRVCDAEGHAGDLRAAFVCGLQERALRFEAIERHPRVVAVRLRPLGAWALFAGLPLRELANRVVDLATVLRARDGTAPLLQRLAETPDLGAALDLLESWVTRRLLDGPAAHPITRAAWACLQASAGGVHVARLARDLGVSARHLNDLFHREVGLSAKGAARVLRFERAAERLARPAGADLRAVADQCGYYDQAHLSRDFRELAGLTPTQYRAAVRQTEGWREIGE